jgi:hypothetical protein
VLLAVAALAIVPLLVIGGALTELFMLALYRYTTQQAVTAPFTATQLEAAIKPKKKRWWSDYSVPP